MTHPHANTAPHATLATWRPARPGDTPGELVPEHGPEWPIDAGPHPYLLHARTAAWSLHTARTALADLARAEQIRTPWPEPLPAAPCLRAPTYGQRHAIGGHADPVSGRVAVELPPVRSTGWIKRLATHQGRLSGLARMLGATGHDPLAAIQAALPRMLPGTARVVAAHLRDEDDLVRGWLDLAPAVEPLPGVACPACTQRRLVVNTGGPEAAWTVTCACLCVGQGCPCGMAGAVEGVQHIWPRQQVIGSATKGE